MAEIVLVHGSWADGSVWLDVLEALHRQGHQARAVHLPMTSLADDIAEVRREIAAFSGPVVLAAHSYGGAVISGAAKDNPRVNALAYFAAYVPDEGETVPSLNERFPDSPGDDAMVFHEDGWSSLAPDRFHYALAADLTPERAAALAAVQRRARAECFLAPAGPGAWRDLPTAYAVSTEDRILNPDLQRWFAERAGADCVELAASHYSLLSQPEAVATVIDKVAARA
ncbi:alpha/beta hydrolase [Amycolatopsis sp. AA4]|uniref:alpha/beta fold hydrolase n=1 Tax=Actinomycetes TaxID=1760 RepID=UPI0001B58A88|nr:MULTISPECIES: alpha/beta hydrolase [Actinomycetes]ATY09908.1 alpha/beta hydrolase [Amycolatopsis sp. AA4]